MAGNWNSKRYDFKNIIMPGKVAIPHRAVKEYLAEKGRKKMKKYYTANFNGNILKRGFWLYVWQISQESGECLYYVGRTGDSSSIYAASPFNRLGQHLNMKDNAKGNSMYRNIRKEGINPSKCDFSMFAYGPIYYEQNIIEKHRIRRDKIAAMENKLYNDLKKMKLTVIGNVRSKKEMTPHLKKKYNNILYNVEQWLKR